MSSVTAAAAVIAFTISRSLVCTRSEPGLRSVLRWTPLSAARLATWTPRAAERRLGEIYVRGSCRLSTNLDVIAVRVASACDIAHPLHCFRPIAEHHTKLQAASLSWRR